MSGVQRGKVVMRMVARIGMFKRLGGTTEMLSRSGDYEKYPNH
jgi:hypothetical protein